MVHEKKTNELGMNISTTDEERTIARRINKEVGYETPSVNRYPIRWW